jgi:hypothetical protein
MSTPAAFHDQLLTELPGCSTAMANRHLVDVAREFCAGTSVWRAAFTPIDLVAGQAAYTLATGQAQSEVVRLTSLALGADLLWLDRDPDENSTATEPQYEPQDSPFTLDAGLTTITLTADEVPTASLAAGLVIQGVLKPTMAATELPDFLLTQYSEAMRFGVLSRLMLMAKKPWQDRALGAAYAGEYQRAKNFAAYQSQVGNTRKILRVRKWG